jgi:hypothetical protein
LGEIPDYADYGRIRDNSSTLLALIALAVGDGKFGRIREVHRPV